MAERRRVPHHRDDYRGFHDAPLRDRRPVPLPIHRAALVEEIEIQSREMRRIVAENHLVTDRNMLLQRELNSAKDEIVRLRHIIPTIRADKDVQTRELTERVLKLEAELRASERLKAEVLQLRAEVQTLNAVRQGLSAQVQVLSGDVTRLQSENKQLTAMRIRMAGMQNERAEAGGSASGQMSYHGGVYGVGNVRWGPYDNRGPQR